MQMKQAGDADAAQMGRSWAIEEGHLKAAVRAAEAGERRAKDRVEPAKDVVRRVEDEFRGARGVEPPAGSRALPIGYVLLVIALFIFEFPMNSLVFRIFGENEVGTWLMTAMIAITLLACAHLLGAHLKHEPTASESRVVGVVWTALLVVMPLAVTIGVGMARSTYLERMSRESGLGTSGVSWVWFCVFNLAVFLAAAVASHFAHDERWAAVARARRAQSSVEAAHAVAEARTIRARALREKRRDAYAGWCKELSDLVQLLTELYRTPNFLCRSDRGDPHSSQKPLSYERYPDLTWPDNLKPPPTSGGAPGAAP